MNSIKTFDCLKCDKITYVRVTDTFKQKLKNEILRKYQSLDFYSKQVLGISKSALRLQFMKQKYFNLGRLLKITSDLGISKEEIYSNILSLYAKGSNTSKEVILPKILIIDKFFVEGYALYLAEGDNGSNGKTIPRKVRLGNSQLSVHKHFIKWLKTYFPNNEFYFRIIIPYPQTLTENIIKNTINFLNLEERQIRIHRYKWQRKTGFIYITCLDSALLIDFLLSIKNTVKELCLQDNKLAASYIRGMMIGEGTAYFNKSRYVRIEMKNEEEIKYLHKLFKLLGYDCKPSLRTNRKDMWSLYIGAKQLDKFSQEIGFGIHEKRQRILEEANNKILRVNQYC